MNRDSEPSPALLAGRRALDDVTGFTLLTDWTWNQHVGKWVLLCRLTINVPDTSLITPSTDWYVMVDASYPWGKIKLYPAKVGGIDKTFQHQSYNGIGQDSVPWRTGDICIDTRVQVLGRHAVNPEPFDAHQRLPWRICRAIAWLEAAGHDKLTFPGEPFELPWFPKCPDAPVKVAFWEDESTFEQWQTIEQRFGSTGIIMTDFNHVVVKQFCSSDGKILLDPKWGDAIPSSDKKIIKGIWLRLEAPPVLPPWEIPTTWGGLQPILHQNQLTLDALPTRMTSALRDGQRHIALLGYPIPRNIGAPTCRMYWTAIWLPHLSFGNQKMDGFRPNETGYRQRDKAKVFYNNAKIDWLDTNNWSTEQIMSRGKLPDNITKRRVCIIGTGALGSVISEMFVRAGVEEIVIIDNDIVEIGNLVRHTTLLTDLNQPKSQAIAQRLRAISPQVHVTAIITAFPQLSPPEMECVRESDIVIDCTAEDSVIYHLSQFDWPKSLLFISLSLGFQAKRLYCYSTYDKAFPHDAYRESIGQWLLKEREEMGDFEFPQEGIGCWHPVFPARIDDVWMFASLAIKYIEKAAKITPTQPELAIFEQEFQEGICIGIRKCES